MNDANLKNVILFIQQQENNFKKRERERKRDKHANDKNNNKTYSNNPKNIRKTKHDNDQMTIQFFKHPHQH